MRGATLPLCAAFLLLAGPGAALTLDLPAGAEPLGEGTEGFGRAAIPTGPYGATGLPTLMVEGEVARSAWRMTGRPDIATLTASLRDQIIAQGYAILLDCADAACGGFDFRFAVDMVDAPGVFVDLDDYLFVSATRVAGTPPAGDAGTPGTGDAGTPETGDAGTPETGDAGTPETGDAGTPEGTDEHVALLISRSSNAGFLQIVHVGRPGSGDTPGAAEGIAVTTEPAAGVAAAVTPAAFPPDELVARLETTGRAPLSDLSFESGSAQLAEGEYASLVVLAAYLGADETRRVALVGHTDTEGGRDANMTLSRSRAASVLERLATRHGIPPQQMEAEGAGYLAPRASNLTTEGREANRRVEVVLIR